MNIIDRIHDVHILAEEGGGGGGGEEKISEISRVFG